MCLHTSAPVRATVIGLPPRVPGDVARRRAYPSDNLSSGHPAVSQPVSQPWFFSGVSPPSVAARWLRTGGSENRWQASVRWRWLLLRPREAAGSLATVLHWRACQPTRPASLPTSGRSPALSTDGQLVTRHEAVCQPPVGHAVAARSASRVLSGGGFWGPDALMADWGVLPPRLCSLCLSVSAVLRAAHLSVSPGPSLGRAHGPWLPDYMAADKSDAPTHGHRVQEAPAGSPQW